MTDPGAPRPLTALDRDTALGLLGGERIGRLAYCVDSRPHLEVVNFVLAGERVIFRIAVSAKLVALGRGVPFAVQADRLDADNRTGWTVTVVGPARAMTAAEIDRLDESPQPWIEEERPRYVALTIHQVHGRMLSAG